MTKAERPTFIEKHGLWSEDQTRLAAEIVRRVETENLHFVRLAWGDTHGYARAKTLTVPAFLSALSGGYNIGVATTTLDSAGARVFSSFTRGGGMGLAEMTGSPNLTLVADPATFRVLPWAPGVGWILGDEYFNDGTPFHFSPRQLLRKTLQSARRPAAIRASSARRSNGICCASPTRNSDLTISARLACAAARSRPSRSSPAITTIQSPTWT